jgi:hypothetical protein
MGVVQTASRKIFDMPSEDEKLSSDRPAFLNAALADLAAAKVAKANKRPSRQWVGSILYVLGLIQITVGFLALIWGFGTGGSVEITAIFAGLLGLDADVEGDSVGAKLLGWGIGAAGFGIIASGVVTLAFGKIISLLSDINRNLWKLRQP